MSLGRESGGQARPHGYGRLGPGDREQAAGALEAVLREADDGELVLTPVQRGYLLGTIATLRAIEP